MSDDLGEELMPLVALAIKAQLWHDERAEITHETAASCARATLNVVNNRLTASLRAAEERAEKAESKCGLMIVKAVNADKHARLAEAQAAGSRQALKDARDVIVGPKNWRGMMADQNEVKRIVLGEIDQALSIPTGKKAGGEDYEALIRLKDAVETTLCIETPKEVREALEAVRR